ncbi:MAG: hypothetical protein HQ515_00380 [Phycisphaeraceae bacterium]|nr:hypothetical protein [Phycisphaeraceae bacterium]
MNPRKLCMLDNKNLITALNKLVKELEDDDAKSGLRACRNCRFGTDNSLAIFDLHCQFGYAYDALSTVLGQLKELSKQSHASRN